MDLIALGCPLVRSYPLELAMAVLAYLGHGVVDGALATLILLAGAATRQQRLRQAGLAALLAVVASGLLANLGKFLFGLPRPTPSETFGFPSGHTTTAFALAGALSQAFPAGAPFFYLLAVLAGVARLYDRSHFVADVIGGALLGSAAGLLIARTLLGPRGETGRPRTRWAWVLPIVVAIPALAFFAPYERRVAAHRIPSAAPLGNLSRDLTVTFGTPGARNLLGDGWSADGTWGAIPFVWAEDLRSTLRLPPLRPADHRFRLRVRPYARRAGRPPCQVMEVALNGVPLGRLLLEKGWNDYELRVPKDVIGRGENELEFRFAYTEPESPRREGRALSAAFASLEVLVDAAGIR